MNRNPEHCSVCADEGRAAEVVAVLGDAEASVRSGAGTETVDTTPVGEVRPGERVLVHAGFAVARLPGARP